MTKDEYYSKYGKTETLVKHLPICPNCKTTVKPKYAMFCKQCNTFLVVRVTIDYPETVNDVKQKLLDYIENYKQGE